MAPTLALRPTFFPALGNTSELVVLFPKLSQFLTLLLQVILQLQHPDLLEEWNFLSSGDLTMVSL